MHGMCSLGCSLKKLFLKETSGINIENLTRGRPNIRDAARLSMSQNYVLRHTPIRSACLQFFRIFMEIAFRSKYPKKLLQQSEPPEKIRAVLLLFSKNLLATERSVGIIETELRGGNKRWTIKIPNKGSWMRR